MPFQKLVTSAYPRRLWSLVGFPGAGKSTFAMQMRGPILCIDADHRADEVARLAAAGVYQLSDQPADNVAAEAIADCLRANMAGSDIKTILVDSLTAIMAPLVTAAILDNDAGRHKNRMTGFKDKALAMRLLQDSIGAWGTDVLYVYHLQSGRDANAQEVTTATVSRTELARLQRSLNVQLRSVDDHGKRGLHVDWARRGRSGMTLWDDTGIWKGMPEKIEAAIYGGLTEADQLKIEQATPTSFPNVETAIAWGFEQGVFEVINHARNAYDVVKRECQPKTAAEMWELWIADVLARKAEKAKPPAERGQQTY